MSSKNIIYVLYNTFNTDLLFWIVVCNLFLSSEKGLAAFDIVHITVLGLAGFLILYPLTKLMIKHTTTKFSIFVGSMCLITSIILFMLGESLVVFAIAEILYFTSSSFKQVSTYMLKNNLDKQGKSGEFVKWQSFGRFGYAFVTLAITLSAGVLFNVSPYLPTSLGLFFALVGLVFALIYKDEKPYKKTHQTTTLSLKANFKDKIFVLLLIGSILPIGLYLFLQNQGTLLIQYVATDGGFSLAQASVLISGILFVARLVRVISDVCMPNYYAKLKDKPKCMTKASVLVIISSICFALGSVVFKNVYIQLVLIAVGYMIVLFVRDTFSTLFNTIAVTHYKGEKQKQMLVAVNIFEKLGRLVVYLLALVLLGVVSLQTTYALLLGLGVAQIFVCVPLSKYLKKRKRVKK